MRNRLNYYSQYPGGGMRQFIALWEDGEYWFWRCRLCEAQGFRTSIIEAYGDGLGHQYEVAHSEVLVNASKTQDGEK